MDPIDIFINLALLVLLNVAIGPDITAHLVQTCIILQYKRFFKQLQQHCLDFIVYAVFVIPFYLRTRTIHPTARAAFRDELEFTPYYS
jgi:hypothetical protein